MRERTAARDRRRAREFESFVAGAAGRLLHAATLLTAEPPEDNPRAQRLVLGAFSHTYARWDRLRGEDPYDRTRQELASRFAANAWRYRRAAPRLFRRAPGNGGAGRPGTVLARLAPQDRLVLVLRLYEGVEEEQIGALVGLPVERVHGICMRAIATLRGPVTKGRTGLPEAVTR